MSKKLYEESNIQDIADAIRTKNGSQDTYKVSDMAQAVLDIDGGTGDMPNLDIVQFGNSPVVENPGYTNPQYYEDIAEAINYAKEHGGGGGGDSDNDLLFHFDDFTNSGKMNAAFYNKTGYLISDEQSKFGGTSLKVNSTPSSHAVYFEDGFTIGDRDFTLDFWAYTTNAESDQAVVSFDYRSLGYYITSGTKRGVCLAYSSGSWSYEDDDQTYSTNILNSWHHFAITRSGSTFHVFTDGIEEDTFEWDHPLAPTTRLSFGTNSAVQDAWRGYIDEFRLKIGEAVWTSNFTPPAEPYT